MKHKISKGSYSEDVKQFLQENKGKKYIIREICNHTGVPFNRMSPVINSLYKFGFVQKYEDSRNVNGRKKVNEWGIKEW